MNDADLCERLGHLPALPMRSAFAIRWDRVKGHPTIDCGWIGEDAAGVWIRVNPLSALADDPGLWDTINAWQCGARESDRRDYEEGSNFETEIRLTLAAAHSREESRRMKKPREEDE